MPTLLTFRLILRDPNESMLGEPHLWRHEVAVKLVWLKFDLLVVLVHFSLEIKKNVNDMTAKVNHALYKDTAVENLILMIITQKLQCLR